MKILAIQFKYFGDAVILTPALKALKTQMPHAELHVLVAAEVAPLLVNLPWITKVWAMPRSRGKAKLSQAFPIIKAMRKEKFDQSIDFGGNDRGALLSFLSGAPTRLGAIEKDQPKLMQRICYTQIIRRLEKENGLVPTPIIAITGYAVTGDRERFLKSGMDDYITKPINENKLIEVIKKFCTKNQ